MLVCAAVLCARTAAAECTGAYAEDLTSLSPKAREAERHAPRYVYAVRTTATYECVAYGAGGDLQKTRSTQTAHGTAFGYRYDGGDTLLLTNEHVAEWPDIQNGCKKISDTLWVLKDKKIGVLGLAFKQNTDDVRMSPAIELCHRLQKEGATLRVHDPKAMEKAKPLLKEATFVEDMNEVAEGCDALVIATEWEEFKKLDLDRARKALTHPILFDGRNLFDPAQMEKLGFIYKSIGR